MTITSNKHARSRIKPALCANSEACSLPVLIEYGKPATRLPMRMLSAAIVIGSLLCLFSCSTAKPKWPKFRANQVNNGVISSSNIRGMVGWAFLTGGDILSEPVVDNDGVIYFGSADHKVYAVNPNGTQKWVTVTGGAVQSSPGIDSDGTLYIGSDDGKVYALDKNTGRLKWAYQTKGPVKSSPAPFGRLVYVGSDDGNIYALDNQYQGSPKWYVPTFGRIRSSPAIARDDTDTVYIGGTDHKLYAIDGFRGTILWRQDLGGEITASPALGVDQTVYIGTNNGLLYALDGKSGKEKWRKDTRKPNIAPGVFRECAVAYEGGAREKVFVANDYGFFAYDAKDGKVLWGPKGDITFTSAAVVPNGVVYVGNLHSLIQADSQTGLAMKVVDLEPGTLISSSPAVGPDGSVYIASGRKLYAIR